MMANLLVAQTARARCSPYAGGSLASFGFAKESCTAGGSTAAAAEQKRLRHAGQRRQHAADRSAAAAQARAHGVQLRSSRLREPLRRGSESALPAMLCCQAWQCLQTHDKLAVEHARHWGPDRNSLCVLCSGKEGGGKGSKAKHRHGGGAARRYHDAVDARRRAPRAAEAVFSVVSRLGRVPCESPTGFLPP